eukprot:c41831_g1_i1.p1 GENE.c41831_g1_i1~~c41831_g1_i1.p1  ORF type:complete len:176 (-),score=23.63 c41831_g1_i1:121-648(-)
MLPMLQRAAATQLGRALPVSLPRVLVRSHRPCAMSTATGMPLPASQMRETTEPLQAFTSASAKRSRAPLFNVILSFAFLALSLAHLNAKRTHEQKEQELKAAADEAAKEADALRKALTRVLDANIAAEKALTATPLNQAAVLAALRSVERTMPGAATASGASAGVTTAAAQSKFL